MTSRIAAETTGPLRVDAVNAGSLYWQFDELRGLPTGGWPFARLYRA